MKVSGAATLHGSPEQVWALLYDPAVLVRTIPGCEKLETVGENAYRMTVTAGVASIKGSYLGDVALVDDDPHTAFTLKASGAGAPGTVSADVRVRLEPGEDGTTLLSYAADAVVGGPVGGVGQRVLAGVAKKTAGEFFAAVDAVLTRTEAPPTFTAPELPAGVPSAPPEQAVYSRPAPATPPPTLLDQAPGAVVGALIALLGVLVGWRIGRRNS